MCTKITPATQVPASTETPVPEKPTSDQVKWNVSEEKFMGAYSQTNEETGALVPFNVESQVLFSSNYMAPVLDQGF